MYTYHTSHRGFTFIEMLVTIGIIGLVFGGITEIILSAIQLIQSTKSEATALALANQRIEYIRSLDYNDAGTISGIPSGSIPQTSTTSLNGLLFHERVLIQYVDSEDDGIGGADTNGILADYKEVRVELSWMGKEGTSTEFLVTNIVPPGIESTDGGGTLTVNVFDAGVNPVGGAEVRLYNDTTTTTIDTIRFTNAQGIAMFAGAPAAANYQITATKAGYSTDMTRSASGTLANPVTPHMAVIESTVSTMNFQIDQLSDLLIRTVEPKVYNEFLDSFTDVSKVATSTEVNFTGSSVVLSGSAGSYSPGGFVMSIIEDPATIIRWDEVTWSDTVPNNTSLTVQVYGITGTSTYTIIPDGDLPGNSAGFTTERIDISGLSISTYPELALRANLGTLDLNVTPTLESWRIQSVRSEVPIPAISFTLSGAKTIGTTIGLVPIQKYSVDHTTDAGGEVEVNNLEWDSYNATLSGGGYDIGEACSRLPYPLAPNADEVLTLSLYPDQQYTVRVDVRDASGNSLQDASVEISRSGFTDTLDSSDCGQVFFRTGLQNQIDYQVQVQKTGFITQTITDVVVDGDELLVVTLTSV